jgi:hypothetical protein
VIARDDDVLTNHVHWGWTGGMEHDPVEPRSVLLPGRVDAPSSICDGCSAVGQFESQSAAAAAADALSGICVAETVVLPGLAYPGGAEGHGDMHLTAAIDQLIGAGARAAFVTDADTGYHHGVDIRAHCETREQALAIGRQMAPIPPQYQSGLIQPWAPGRKLNEDQVRARMYLASIVGRGGRRDDVVASAPRLPGDELESKIWQVVREWVEDHEGLVSLLVASATRSDPDARDEFEAAFEKHKAAVRSLLGEEAEELGSPWYLHWDVLVENNDVCLSSVWCMTFAAGFPALVRWLRENGVRSAKYAVYNLMRP